jgi:hypothetical protein
MRLGRFRAAIVLLLVVSAFVATVPVSSAADSETVYLPWVPNGDTTGGLGPWNSRIEIQNPSSTLCSIQVATPKESGGWTVQNLSIMSPNSLADLTPDDIGLASPGGAVSITSSGCKAAVSVKQVSPSFADAPWSNGANVVAGYTGITQEDAADHPDWILPIVQTNNGWNSYIRVSNFEGFNTKTVTVDVYPYHNLAGNIGQVFSETVAVVPGGTQTIDLLDVFGQTGFVGFARVTSRPWSSARRIRPAWLCSTPHRPT